jgi:hypothetical protein
MSDAAPIVLLDDWRSGQRLPWTLANSKRRWLARKASSVHTILVHATGVRHGFGVDGRLVAAAKPVGVEAFERVSAELRRARYRKTPYHGLYSPRDRVSVVQWAATDFTYHGNAPNAVSLGWAYDGKFTPDESDDLDIEGGRASLRHLINAALEQGCPLRRVTAHAQHSNKPHDPGARVWLEVVEPVADEFGLGIAMDWVTGNGRDEIDRWRRAFALGRAA